ncbi:MAG: glycosyltransferase [Alphaproteobacteria bacterium]|uniref:Glycosyltransferase n=1 Tax=Candidatus Nitrobium versatile TaxID=2884831 RepID=A0A953JA81_9BACT|nr:glycosyltransferase [Candidatus Nitrobium versatile]
MEKLRLMHITHDLAIGGLQQVVVTLCKTTDRRKFDLSVLCLRDTGELAPEVEKEGIRVHSLPRKENGVDYLSFLKVAKILRRGKIDIIHTHNTQPFIDGTTGALLAGVRTIVHTDHSRIFPDKRRYMIAERIMSHFAYKVVGVSHSTSRDLIHYEKIAPRKVMTIPNGIDGSAYRRAVDRGKKKRELGIAGKDPVIGLGVRLVKQKGIGYLLRAMPEVRRAFPDSALVIAGKGEYESVLKREAAELGIADTVFFIGPRMDMAEVLQVFDLYVLPTLWEGLPLVLLEALAAGCPLLATDVGGNSMVIEHGVNGSLVEPESPAALSAEIIRLLKDTAARDAYRMRGKEVFEEKFSAAIMARNYQELYLRGRA